MEATDACMKHSALKNCHRRTLRTGILTSVTIVRFSRPIMRVRHDFSASQQVDYLYLNQNCL